MINPNDPISSEESVSKIVTQPKITTAGDQRLADAFKMANQSSKSAETKNVEKAVIFDLGGAKKFIDEAQKMPAFIPLINRSTAEKYLQGEPNGTYLMFTQETPSMKFNQVSVGFEKGPNSLHVLTVQEGKIKDFHFGGWNVMPNLPNSLKDFFARPENKEVFKTPYNPTERLLNYKSNTSAAKAIELLTGNPPGTYLVRDSSDPKFVAALSMVNSKGDIDHFRFVEQGGKLFFEGETREDQKFSSIEDLILNNRDTFTTPFKEKPTLAASSLYQPILEKQDIMPGYVPNINSFQAEIRLTGKQPGTYMIRDSSDSLVFKSLSLLKSNGAIEHYRIFNENGKFFFQGALEGEKASTFEALIANNRNTFSKPYSG